jgi:hypothetical protein
MTLITAGTTPAWVAIDPGPHTGIAIWFPDTQTWKHQTLMLGPFPDLVELAEDPHKYLWEWLHENVQPYDHLVCEKFEYDRDKARNSPKIDYAAAEYVGVIRLWAQQHVKNFCYQTRQAVGKQAYWSDDKLRRVGVWKPGKDFRHEMDATRHLLYHYTFCAGLQDFNMQLR